jgi:peptidoglycan/LPS O-acetylase OafA/YrhL
MTGVLIVLNGFAEVGLVHLDRVVAFLVPGILIKLAVLFMAGSAMYLYHDRITYSLRVASALGLILVVAVFFTSIAPILYVAVFPYLLLTAAFRWVGPKVDVKRFGDLSYGMYIYAFPIQQSLVHLWGPKLNPITLFLCALPVTLSLAALSWRFVEAPAMRSVKTLGKRSYAKAVAAESGT